jgi:uncharacterized BrkB/YihY/UPF0761 family membrane protein
MTRSGERFLGFVGLFLLVGVLAYCWSAADQCSRSDDCHGYRVAYQRAPEQTHEMIPAFMTATKLLGLASACLGALGTALLYRGSFSNESFGAWMDPQLIAEQTQRNLSRQQLQRLGLALLTLSFILQGIALFVE